MNTMVRWLWAPLLVGALLASFAAGRDGGSSPTTWHRPELEYLKAVNRAGPPRDPQLLLLLMGQYANANLHRDGIELFSTLVKEFEPRLSDRQKSLYLGAIGLLRAGHANQVPLLQRSGWVRDTIAILTRFFGTRFRVEEVQSFTPDITIDRHTEVKMGGTRLEFIPVQGGETHDALFIHLPEHGVMFVGDFIMPYLGAPFVEEGNLQGLLEAIDIVVQKHPRHLLHGHEPLTRAFASPSMLANLKTYLAWLHEEVLAAIRHGAERASIHQANLIPPGLLAGDPDAHLPYIVMRENVINRIYDQNVGYWQPDLQGIDYVSRADRGSLLIDYLGISERQLVKATERMIADGKYELAATTLEWTKDRFAGSRSLADVERLTYLKLMEKYQEFNPFKFIIYSGKVGDQTPQMESKQSIRQSATAGHSGQ